jgi:hypothetical protein
MSCIERQTGFDNGNWKLIIGSLIYIKKERMSQHSSFSLTKPIKLIKPKLMN